MPVTIEVYRGAGDRPGDDIIEPLIGDSLAAARCRGTQELDARAHLMQRTQLELAAPRLDFKLGDLIAVADPTQGVTWRGKIIGIAHSLAQGEAPTTLTVERPVDG